MAPSTTIAGAPLAVVGSSATLWWGNEATVRNLQAAQRVAGVMITHVVNTVGAPNNAVVLTPDERLASVTYLDLNMVDETGMRDDEVLRVGSMAWLTGVAGRPDLEDCIVSLKARIDSEANNDRWEVETHKVRERLVVEARCLRSMWHATKHAIVRAVAFVQAALESVLVTGVRPRDGSASS